ncbi:alanine dehydrogenase [Gracilibacillus ureilyticus]|uniref:Alanine dehydrogenase n=1 Tax=Gracilibacillus ureilyticus TaxID=531814 RepID=A0A1H9QEC9_9BACI|nr:alanine dehydrogenase [Gracilibacillus ureilyticus]SER58239.1 alanine dehydrogenase [Gracilibacillus ureilyticus]
MKIGVPKEVKQNENRVALTPAGVLTLTKSGHQVFVETEAGEGSGISDHHYQEAGAVIVPTAEQAWGQELVVKVKEPQKEEFAYFSEGQLLFTYLHLAAEQEVAEALIAKKVTGIAYETIQSDSGELPLLTPMSEIAGRMAVQSGVHFLEKINGGKGVLVGGVPGVEPARIVIIGGGIVGTNAAMVAAGLGADVTLLDINISRLRQLEGIFQGKIKTLASNEYNIRTQVKNADLLIGAVLIPGAKAPKLVTDDMIQTMEAGSVVVDVAVDQGGSIETVDQITTHDNPVFIKHGVTHYAVANIPGAVPKTATYALTNVTTPYVIKLANLGLNEFVKEDPSFAKGLNTYKGKIVHEAIAQGLDRRYVELHTLFQ